MKCKGLKSTLDWSIIRMGRIRGNSTRQVDLAIDLLYSGYIVKVEDHYMVGENRQANMLLFERIRRRIEAEHRIDLIDFNQNNLTLKLNIIEHPDYE